MEVVNHDKEWDIDGDGYKNMVTEIKGYRRISYKNKKEKAEAEILDFIKECKSIEEVRQKIDSNEDVQDSGRAYLLWAVINAFVETNEVWWATRTD